MSTINTNILSSVLCPPGSGVFTVNTAKETKDYLQKSLYGDADVEKSWLASLEQANEHKGVTLLGICSDCGGGIQRGANWGPLFLRSELLKNHKDLKYFDVGDIRVIPHLLHDKYLNAKTIANCQRALYGDNNELPVSPLSLTKFTYDELLKNNQHGIFSIGGDHSVSYPIVKSWLEDRNKRNIRTGIIHFDAHTDLLVERLGIDLCFGSWLTHVLDDLGERKNCYQFGIRSSGKDKSHWEKEFGLNQYWTKEVKDIGAEKLAKRACEELKKRDVEELYISFDIDAVDSKYAPATGTPEPDGLEPHECVIMINEFARNFKITGADMVEIAPKVGNDEAGAIKTLEVGAIISSKMIEAINSAYN